MRFVSPSVRPGVRAQNLQRFTGKSKTVTFGSSDTSNFNNISVMTYCTRVCIFICKSSSYLIRLAKKYKKCSFKFCWRVTKSFVDRNCSRLGTSNKCMKIHTRFDSSDVISNILVYLDWGNLWFDDPKNEEHYCMKSKVKFWIVGDQLHSIIRCHGFRPKKITCGSGFISRKN